jgi:predicted lipid-binding transport protein (Tim44 family)
VDPINSLLGATATPNYNIDQILQATQPQSQPSGFRRVLGGLVGGIGNLVAPGIGSVIGNAIMGGSGLAGGLSTDTAKYLQLQQQMNVESEQFQAISSVMKSRHDASMAAIRNIS